MAPGSPRPAFRRPVGQGQRARTLRGRGHGRRKTLASFLATFGVCWSRGRECVAEYQKVRFDEPCGPTVHDSFRSALGFFETGGGAQCEERPSADPWRKAPIGEGKIDVRRPLELKRTVPCRPIAVVAALEARVTAPGGRHCLRRYAWRRLRRDRGAFRFDDCPGLRLDNVRFTTRVFSTVSVGLRRLDRAGLSSCFQSP